jgi:hypothetical protein
METVAHSGGTLAASVENRRDACLVEQLPRLVVGYERLITGIRSLFIRLELLMALSQFF